MISNGMINLHWNDIQCFFDRWEDESWDKPDGQIWSFMGFL